MIKRYVLTEQYDEDNFRKIVNKLERDDHMGDLVKYEDVEELINPWKDASKELPEPDCGCPVLICTEDYEKVVGGYLFGDGFECWVATREPQKRVKAIKWMYIPEVNNE